MLISVCLSLLSVNTGPQSIPVIHSQATNASFQAVNSLDNVPAQKVKVGDIEISYKQLGNSSGTSIVLISGDAMTKDMWSPTLLKELSSNQTVII